MEIPALAALALVSTVCRLVVAYEAIRYRESRVGIRQPEVGRTRVSRSAQPSWSRIAAPAAVKTGGR